VAAVGAAVGGLGFASPALANDNGGGNRVVGSWKITRQDKGSTTKMQSVLSFAAGNVIVVLDIQPLGPVFTGSWESEGKRFRATFWAGAPGPDPDSAGPTIRVRIRDGEVENGTISGDYVFTVFDPTGAEIPAAGGSGSFTGKRITA
jgi:hypothetical protein